MKFRLFALVYETMKVVLIDSHIVLVVAKQNVVKQRVYLSETSLSYKLAWPGVILSKRHLPHVIRPPSKPHAVFATAALHFGK